jgi:RNA polymerase sigma-70 factor (ECF subfamily)
MSSDRAENVGLARPGLEPESGRDFDAIYQAHFAFVWRSLRRFGVPENVAEDAAQDVFVVVHRRLADLRPEASARSWLFGIVLRVARDYRRALQRKGNALLKHEDQREREVPEACSPFERTAQSEAARVLEQFLATLDDDKRAVFVLAELEEMTVPEIAETLGANLNTVYSRVRAARDRFAAFVESIEDLRV